MPTDRPVTHEHLLTLANMVKAAADDGDLHRLRSTVWTLYGRLLEHLDGEALSLARTAPGDSRILLRGQQRITKAVSMLVRNLELGAAECNCRALTDLLAAELEIQAKDERRCLNEPGAGNRCSRSPSIGRWSGLRQGG